MNLKKLLFLLSSPRTNVPNTLQHIDARPGMHQLVEDDIRLLLTPEDEEFLRELKVCIHQEPVRRY